MICGVVWRTSNCSIDYERVYRVVLETWKFKVSVSSNNARTWIEHCHGDLFFQAQSSCHIVEFFMRSRHMMLRWWCHSEYGWTEANDKKSDVGSHVKHSVSLSVFVSSLSPFVINFSVHCQDGARDWQLLHVRGCSPGKSSLSFWTSSDDDGRIWCNCVTVTTTICLT